MSAIRSSRAVARALERGAIRSTPLPAVRLAAQPSIRSPASVSRIQPRSFSISIAQRKEEVPSPSGIEQPKIYSYQDVLELSTKPQPNRILIDVREPNELLQTGRIPTAKSIPISSAPDAFFMPEEDFETKFGFPRPSEKDEVIFYCKAGVRSRQAALLAGQARPAFGGKVGNYNGSWLDWEKNGGKAEREGDQGEESSVSGVTSSGGAPSTPRP